MSAQRNYDSRTGGLWQESNRRLLFEECGFVPVLFSEFHINLELSSKLMLLQSDWRLDTWYSRHTRQTNQFRFQYSRHQTNSHDHCCLLSFLNYCYLSLQKKGESSCFVRTSSRQDHEADQCYSYHTFLFSHIDCLVGLVPCWFWWNKQAHSWVLGLYHSSFNLSDDTHHPQNGFYSRKTIPALWRSDLLFLLHICDNNVCLVCMDCFPLLCGFCLSQDQIWRSDYEKFPSGSSLS